MSVLGVDIGSSSVKAVAFDLDARVLAQAESGYPPYITAKGNVVEMPAEAFFSAFVEAVRSVAENVSDIEALAVSSHGETFIPVDHAGTPLLNAIMNMDNRAYDMCGAFSREASAIYRITGLPVQPLYPVVKIAWLRENNPDVFSRAAKFLSPPEYVLARMGLGFRVDYTMACRTMGFDIRAKKWDAGILEMAGVSADRFSEAVESGTLIGRLSADSAKLLGLRAGVAVAAGAHDQPCGALGSGAVESGDAVDAAGTYECLTVVSHAPRNTSEARSYFMNSYCHCLPGLFITLGFFPAGVMSAWFLREFSGALPGDSRIYRQMEEAVQSIPGPTGLCVAPFLTGSNNPVWDARATGIIHGLTPGATRAHIYKAIYEGIACELARNVRALERVVPAMSDSISINGGNAKHAFSVKLRADITGKSFCVVKNPQSVAQGAALLAGKALGAYEDAAEAAKRMRKVERVVSPDPASVLAYREQIGRYARTCGAERIIREEV